MTSPINHAWAVLKEAGGVNIPDRNAMNAPIDPVNVPNINPADLEQSRLTDYGFEVNEPEPEPEQQRSRFQDLPKVLGQTAAGAGKGLFNTLYGAMSGQKKISRGNVKDSMNIKP